MIKTGWQILTVEQIILKSLYNLEFVHIWDHVGVKFILTFTFFSNCSNVCLFILVKFKSFKNCNENGNRSLFSRKLQANAKMHSKRQKFCWTNKNKSSFVLAEFQTSFFNQLFNPHFENWQNGFQAFRLSHFSSCQFFSLFSGICTHLCLGHNCIWLNWPVVTFFLNSTSILDKTLSK